MLSVSARGVQGQLTISLDSYSIHQITPWFIVDAVGQMDLREFYAGYRSDGWGAAAYDPEMMVAILLYAYCLGLRSSRRIARALEEDVGFRVVAANQQPDFRTICRFSPNPPKEACRRVLKSPESAPLHLG